MYDEVMRLITVVPLAVVLVALVVSTLMARRRGYNIGGRVVVRCRAGHLFTTLWLPGASLKSVRLGWARFQRCPVGHHWTLVRPVREADLTDEQRRMADSYYDGPVP